MTTDTDLTGYLDGELDVDARAAVERALREDPALAARLEELRAPLPGLKMAFDRLAEEAPVARLRGRLPGRSTARNRLRWLAGVAAALALLLAGAIVGRMTASRSDDWREAVTEYMALYADASFPETTAQDRAGRLEALSKRIGRALDVETLAIAGEPPVYVASLQYDGAPLAQLGYRMGKGGVALCIIADKEPDAPPATSTAGDFTRVTWARNGLGYMVIGAGDAKGVRTFADAARTRLE